MEEKQFSRPPAIKTVIKELLQADFYLEKENKPNYLLLPSGEKAFRVNVLGLVLRKEKQGQITNFLLDDGTGSIVLRFFEENKRITQIEGGDTLLIIGKLREYAEEKYLSPEIYKKIDPLWLKVRAQEFSTFFSPLATQKEPVLPQKVEFQTAEEIEEEMIEEEEAIFSSSPLSSEKMLQLIKELDAGEGAPIEELIEKVKMKGAEEFIQRMLERGDIFQISPGKIKIL